MADTPHNIRESRERVRRALLAGDVTLAAELMAEALAIHPRDPPLLAQRAALLELQGDREAAFDVARSVMALTPGEPLAAAIAARWLLDNCQAAAAREVAESCLALQPEAWNVRRALSSACLFLGDARAARQHAEQAAARQPVDATAISSLLMTCLYDDTLSTAERTRRHQELGARIDPARSSVPLAPAGGRRVRIGFLSGDFRHHPVGRLAAPVLEQLDRERFEPFCYADVTHPDAFTELFRRLPLHWCEVSGQSDDEVLSRMRADRLDVLVDLAGHSQGGRPRVLRGRAAPLQLSWLGYPHGSGLPEMDVLIGDAHTLPPGCEAAYHERPLRLPSGMFCLQSPEDLPPVGALPMLSGMRPTLGSFNHLAKLSDRTVALWSRILQRLPSARLVLCAIPLLEAATRDITLARFQRHGIEAERIELRPPRPPGTPFLRQYDDIDLALDPLAFSGGATTLDALRQGVAVVTLPDEGFHTRMSASLLHQLRLDAFVAGSESEYEAIVLDWIARPEALAGLRAGMRRRFAVSPAADVDRYVREFEQAVLGSLGS